MWGNPFLASEYENASLEYAKWLGKGGRREVWIQGTKRLYDASEIKAKVKSLAGQKLGCWCAPDRCHGEILARLADSEVSFETELDTIVEELEENGRLQDYQEPLPFWIDTT